MTVAPDKWAKDALRWREGGLTLAEIGARLGVSRQRVHQVVTKFGGASAKPGTRARSWVESTPGLAEAIRRGETYENLSAICGVSSRVVFYRLKNAGIRKAIRSKAERLAEDLPSRVVVTEDGCWLWNGAVNASGYVKDSGKHLTKHRLVYEVFAGEIPAKTHVDHVCHRRSCMNPDHLQLLTPSENSAKKRRGAFTQECALRMSLGLPVHPSNRDLGDESQGAA